MSQFHHQRETESSHWRDFSYSRRRYCGTDQQSYHQHSQHNRYYDGSQHDLKVGRVTPNHDNPWYSSAMHRNYTATQHNQTTCEYSRPNNRDKRTFQTRDHHTYPKVQHKQQHDHCSSRKGAEQVKRDPNLVRRQNKVIRTETQELLLPFPAEGVTAIYTNDPVTAEAWLRNHIGEESPSAIGLDIEWKPQFTKKKDGGVENKTAVLQLAVEESCLVLHLCHMQSFPKSLATVLGNKAILKVGSGILGDALKLRRDCRLTCVGRSDTQVLAKTCQVHTGGVGLKTLAKTVLKIDFIKPKTVSMSNWEQFPLKTKQIEYAALDAWISLKIFLHLKKMLKELKGISTVPCDLGEPSVQQVVACEACGKKCKGNEALRTHIEEYGHTRCENCNKLFQTHVPQKHRKKCVA